ncbi:MAG: siderophore-interacting protein [Solimonas sp.]
MTTPSPVSDTPPRQPGRLGRALIRVLMKQAHVVEAESVAEGFRLLTLDGPEFRGVQWLPGQKMQIAMGSAFVARTFTPIEWDATAGRTRILGYAHGDGPGSAWLRNARPGDACDVFGPRASLDAGQAFGLRVVLGDETSIGLAYALSRQTPGAALQGLFEVNAVAPARAALARLALDGAELFERTQNDAQLEDIERRLPALADSGASFVLTGKAASIQRLRRVLKALGVPAARLTAKPYWAPGKTGLD